MIKEEMKVTKGIDLIERVMKEPKPEFIWDGIPKGSIGLITGVAKTGKTTFAENLAISLSVGKKYFFDKPLLGKPQKVLFINLEESYRIRSWRNMRQISVLSEEEKALFSENYISIPTNFPEYITSDEDWELFRNYILNTEADIIFIDSLTHMFNGEIEKSKPAIDFTKKLNEYLGKLNKTIIIIHHNIKGNDKPLEQNSIAGSRVILQEFQFAYGLANIPTGGNYFCMLNNKYVECDSSKAITYKIDNNNWVTNMSTVNKYNLYKSYSSSNNKIDGRNDETNQDLIYEFITNQNSMISQAIITTKKLNKYFVEAKIMSKDTLHKSINKLIESNKISKVKKGEYKLRIDENEDE